MLFAILSTRFMNFKFFAFGVTSLFLMVICVIILTLIGNQFLSKDQLNGIIEPLFLFGFVVVGFVIAGKAVPNKYLHSSVLALILVAMMSLFLDIIKQVPIYLWKFLLLSFVLLQIGILIKLAFLKFKRT